ncbi:hypothetical protein ES703_10726 [subsurface metagenome]
MRTKEEIIDDLKKTKQDHYSTYHDGTPPNLITIMVLIDIRDQLAALTTILGSVEKIIYREG